eukprot:PhF_6_TR37653/c0_g1_i1/m.56029
MKRSSGPLNPKDIDASYSVRRSRDPSSVITNNIYHQTLEVRKDGTSEPLISSLLHGDYYGHDAGERVLDYCDMLPKGKAGLRHPHRVYSTPEPILVHSHQPTPVVATSNTQTTRDLKHNHNHTAARPHSANGRTSRPQSAKNNDKRRQQSAIPEATVTPSLGPDNVTRRPSSSGSNKRGTGSRPSSAHQPNRRGQYSVMSETEFNRVREL